MKKALGLVLVLLLAISGCALAGNELIGRWEGTGYEYGGMMLDPTGEWLEFESDTRGTVFIVNEYPFDYTVEGDTIIINEDVGVRYEAKLVGDEIILDTGMLYHFSRDGAAAAPAASGESEVPETSGDEGASEPSEDVCLYEAISCKIGDEAYKTEGETLVLNLDGTGTVRFGSSEYDIEWTLEDADFAFTDESGDSFKGTAVEDVIIGIYTVTYNDGSAYEYEYIYQVADGE